MALPGAALISPGPVPPPAIQRKQPREQHHRQHPEKHRDTN
jgi:hypothetical protein